MIGHVVDFVAAVDVVVWHLLVGLVVSSIEHSFARRTPLIRRRCSHAFFSLVRFFVLLALIVLAAVLASAARVMLLLLLLFLLCMWLVVDAVSSYRSSSCLCSR